MSSASINIQGNILSGEILDKFRSEELKHQAPSSFGLGTTVRVRDEIGLAWSEVRGLWQTFNLRRERITADESGTTETRNFWMLPFLTTLGYNVEKATAEVIDEKTYAISHRAANLEGFPVHIMGVNDSLDKRRETGGPRLSPHALVQEYLNKTDDHLYALVTNGIQLRLLRDATRLVRLAFLEFDLEKMMEEELFSDFAILYRVLHATRMPSKKGEGEASVIEYYHQESLDAGSRIREKLRLAVEYALKELANGFLSHPGNADLQQLVAAGQLDADTFYKQLLRLIYRFLFLLVTEDRNLVFPPGKQTGLDKARQIYSSYYSIDRIRRLVLRKLFVDVQKHDMWESIKVNFQLFERDGFGEKMHLKPLGSGFFEPGTIDQLDNQCLHNGVLLDVMQQLCYFEQESGTGLARVNYGDLDVEEFGSVYESLLELYPVIGFGENGKPWFSFAGGSERKTTGSYYTRHDLVAQLLKSAMDPMLEDRLKGLATTQQKEQALLALKVCDPACGSGHFLLAAARKIALRLAQVRTGEDNPGKEPLMLAMRQVIQHCIYGVDKNPSAVELCKVVLWIEGHHTGKPLSFLDHKIRPGDSLVGVDHLERLKKGIPDDAFSDTTDDVKSVVSRQKRRNATFRQTRQFDLFFGRVDMAAHTKRYAEGIRAVEALQGDTLDEISRQKRHYEAMRSQQGWWKDNTACNLFVYAFFQNYTEGKPDHLFVNSEYLARYLLGAGSLNAQLEAMATSAALKTCFFHWPLEFPDVDEQGGFDLILANPPWERIKLQEKEFFGGRDGTIEQAPNAAARKRLISTLGERNPALLEEYKQGLHESESSSKFIRDSGRYPLTGRGDINTYSIFAELIKEGINQRGSAGFIVPTGIATDDTNKHYFASLVEHGQLVSLFDFENRKKIFPSVDSRFKFSLLTLGMPQPGRQTRFGFFLHDVLDLADKRRVFTLTQQDFLNINPNTKTTPIFRTRQDAELTAKIYSRVPVLINEEKGQNPWGVRFMAMFHMSNDSHLFRTRQQMEQAGFTLMGNRFVKGDEVWLPLYESKMIWHFDHRFGSYAGVNSRTSTQINSPTPVQYQDPCYQILPWYWVSKEEVERQTSSKWFLGFRDITNSTNERTMISSIVPLSAIGHTQPLIISSKSIVFQLSLSGLLSSITFDFIARQKVGGTHMTYGYLKQLPAIDVEVCNKIGSIVFELYYVSFEIKAFADDLWREADDDLKQALWEQWEDNKKATGGHSWQAPDWAPAYPEIDWQPDEKGGCPLSPFKWDEEHRAMLRAELDAWYALLYGLERDELRYILDPQDVYGEDFPGETFRVLKEKEIRKYGEYRTRRMVLEAYDRLRPGWNMEAHLVRLKEVWEACQVDLSADAGKKQSQDVTGGIVRESKMGYGGLFDDVE